MPRKRTKKQVRRGMAAKERDYRKKRDIKIWDAIIGGYPKKPDKLENYISFDGVYDIREVLNDLVLIPINGLRYSGLDYPPDSFDITVYDPRYRQHTYHSDNTRFVELAMRVYHYKPWFSGTLFWGVELFDGLTGDIVKTWELWLYPTDPYKKYVSSHANGRLILIESASPPWGQANTPWRIPIMRIHEALNPDYTHQCPDGCTYEINAAGKWIRL